MSRRAGASGALLALALLACGEREALPLAEQGSKTYQANCIACHNPDPTREGSLGPALKCSPQELVESRVLRAEYPPGYKPKRESKLMPAQPFLRREIPGLAAFLACP